MTAPAAGRRREWITPLAVVLLVPALLWGLLWLAVPPDRQDFPLNDDWKYAHAAFALYCGQGLRYFHSASMPVLGQWLWAWPFAALLGNTHVALRLSTMVLSLFGLAAFFDLLRQGGLAPRRAAIVAACLGLNPLYFLLSGTFMTDVPALAFSLAALALYGRAMQTAAGRPALAGAVLAVAVVCAVLAALTRQNTIAVPVAAGLVLVLRYPLLRFRPVWLVAVVLPAGVALAMHYWVTTQPNYLFWEKAGLDLGRILLVAFTATVYMGLFSLPLLLLNAVPSPGKRLTVGAGFATALPCLLVGACFYWLYKRNELLPLEVWWHEHMPHGFWAPFSESKASLEGLYPYLGNMLTPWGQFRPYATVAGDRPLLLGPGVRVGLSLVGCVAGAALLARLGRRLRAGAWREPLTPFTVVHLLILLVPSALWDRYLIVLLPGALYLAIGPCAEAYAARTKGWLTRRTAALGVLAVFGLFSLGLLHDWLSWNAARWTLGRRAVAQGIPPSDINGGFEWDGWHSGADATGPFPPRWTLSFSVLRSTRPVDREPYDMWLVPSRREFYLLEHLPPAASEP